MTDPGGAGTPPPAIVSLLAGAVATPILAGEAGAAVVRYDRPDGRSFVLKSGSGAVARDVEDEAAQLRWLAGRVACAEFVDCIATADGAWLLTGAVPGRTGDDWLDHSPDSLPRVIDGFSAFLRELHALPVADCPLAASADDLLAAARRNLAAGDVDEDDFDDDHAGWSAARVWEKLIGLTQAPPADPVVTHGDYSLGNLLLDEDGTPTGIIDLGRLGVGDRYRDLAILHANLADHGAAAQEQFLRAYGLDQPDRDRLEFYRTLDEFF